MATSLLSLDDAATALDELLTPPRLRDPVRPLLALEEREDAFEMRAQLPPLRPEDLEIYAGEHFLELALEHEATPRLRCCLVRHGPRLSFARRYPLSIPIVPERADARLVAGELWLRLPKRVGQAGPRGSRVRVPVSG